MASAPVDPAPTQAQPQGASTPVRPGKKLRLGFVTAAGVLLTLVAMGHGLGVLVHDFAPYRALLLALREDADGAAALLAPSNWTLRDGLTALLLLSLLAYVVVWRELIARFFRSMYVGVSLVTLSVLAVILGVLVPQIDGFEDPQARVPSIADVRAESVDAYLQAGKFPGDDYYGPHPQDNPALKGLTRDQVARLKDYRRQFDAFRWAESYFAYHLLHGLAYGAFLPKAEIPEQALAGLDRYERVYGREERRNREKTMEAAFASRPKTEAIEVLMKRAYSQLRTAFDVCTALDLNRTYKSHWFSALLTLLAISIALNTFRGKPRKWFSIQKVGYFTTHIGMLVMLGGGWVSNVMTDRGILQLYLDNGAEDTYWQHYRSDKLRQMPFAVKLDRFARKEWKALQIEPQDQSFTSRLPRYTLWPGRTIQLDYIQDAEGEWRPQLELRVVELYDHAVVDTPTVREDESATEPFPVFELEAPVSERDRLLMEQRNVALPEGGTRRLLLSPFLRDQGYVDPAGQFRLLASYDGEVASLFPSDDETLGTLYVERLGADDPMAQPIAVRVGETADVGGGYSITFAQATTDFRVGVDTEKESSHPAPLAEQPDGFRAVWIDIRGPATPLEPEGRVERRAVFERVDAVQYGLQDRYDHKNLVASLAWNRWSAPGPARFVLDWGAGREPELVAQDGTRTPAPAGAELALPGPTKLAARRYFRSAVLDKRLRFEAPQIGADGFDASFYSTDARGLALDVVHAPGSPEETVERIELATTDTQQANVWVTPDHRFVLRFLENTDGFPFDWRSVLSIVERDAAGREFTVPLGSERDREIRVNDYFTHRGYRFFQTNADPQKPNYSGIGVVYDPGIPAVLVGMYTIILGAALAFLVRPIVLARRGAAPTSGVRP